MSWEHDLAGWIKDQGKTGGIETGYLVGHVISPKWSEADEAWTDGELIISTLEGQAMLTEGMLDRLDAGGELHDGMTVALIPGARALRGGQRFFVAEIPGHGALPGRDSPDCHPIEAITGLREELDDHDDRLDHLETIRVPALEHDMNETGGRVPVLEGRVEALEDLESALGEDLSDLSDRVDDIVTHGGEPNVIETVKRNGVALPVTGKAVDVSVPVKTSELTNDSGFLTQETDPTVPAWAKAATKPSYTAQEVGALPDTTVIPSRTSDLTNDSGFLTQETDPTVPAWAKAARKPSYTAAEVGAAATSHSHAAGDITGTLSADRLPIVPITKGGTGAADTLAALTALGGLSALDQGVLLAANSSLNTLLTPGTYYSPSGTRTDTITGAPISGGGFRLFVLVGHNGSTFVQLASASSRLLIRSTGDQGETWTAWTELSRAGHTHAAGDITDGALPIGRGGTGETTALAALTALGGLSALDFGTILPTNGSLNTLVTPGTYYSPSAARSATITGAPVTDAGFRLFVLVGHNSGTFVQLANVNARVLIRSTADGGTSWTAWAEFSLAGHGHAIGDVSGLQAALNGKSDTGHGHDIAEVTGLQTALDGKSDTGHTHSYLPLSGGTLTANLTIRRDSGTTSLILDSPEKADVGRARFQVQKNASASSDNGTNLIDYVWGDGSSATRRTALRLQASAAQLRDRIRFIDYAAGGSYTTYRLYGDHNAPTIANITGLEARLAAIEARLTALEGG